MDKKQIATIAIPCVAAFLAGEYVGVKRANNYIKRRSRRKAKAAVETDVAKIIAHWYSNPLEQRSLNDVLRDWYYTNEIKSIYNAK